MTVEEFDEPEVLGEVVQGDDVAKGSDGHRVGLWDLGLLFFEDGGEEILRRAKVDGADDFGLAVNALAFTGVVIGLAVNDLGGKAGHAQNPPLPWGILMLLDNSGFLLHLLYFCVSFIDQTFRVPSVLPETNLRCL